MGQTLYRATLFVCGLLSFGVIANLFVLQRPQSRLAMTTPGTYQKNPERARAASPVLQPRGTAATADLVRAIQRELRSKDYINRAPDGALDMPTRAAIWAWERDNGLGETASPSEDLLKALLLGAAIDAGNQSRRNPEAVAALVRHVQILLKSRTTVKLAINGKFDDGTRAAISAFQRQQGQPLSGQINAELVQRLENAGRHGR